MSSGRARGTVPALIERILFEESWVPWLRFVLTVLVFSVLVFALSGTISWLWPVVAASGALGVNGLTKLPSRRRKNRSP